VNNHNIHTLDKYNIDFKNLSIEPGSFQEVKENVFAKRCYNVQELSDFYKRKYNLSNQVDTYFDVKNTKLCNLLRKISLSHYEKRPMYATVGSRFLNSNGHTYQIVDVIKKSETSMDALVVDTDSLNVIYASGLQSFTISYDNDPQQRLSHEAYEWGSGMYYGVLNTDMNLRIMRLDALGYKEPAPVDIYEFRTALFNEYSNTQDILKDPRLDCSIRNAAKKVLETKFKNLDVHEFDRALMNGDFDMGFKKDKDKSRGGI